MLFKELGRFSSFLGFVKGTRVGFGHLEGEKEDAITGLRLVGFSKSDGLKAPSNWYFASMSKELPTLFQSYLAVMDSESGRKNFGRAINYYKASNTAQSDNTEIALLIGMAGLEALAFHVLHDNGGWSADLLKRATLADMLRATARLLSIDDDPVRHAPPLMAWISAASKPGFDGFNVLAEFRNGLTHPVTNFSYDGQKLLHAWFASQWLLEVLMLAYLGYRGKYQDRRKQLGGWAGTLVDMPVRDRAGGGRVASRLADAPEGPVVPPGVGPPRAP
ncbi:hypothetical protein [Mesorhizobium sp.]|uniref:hypothetical protein n=1 Tax=Mesorhizobium sp. TaxID=1871066 RepID=UPI000FE9B7C2|nr:hypothetical protein [Mesorhizobium sp.]RWP51364.1 MAG: hypothetical protein EOR06_22455 [Mesorhizobium sp.]